MHLRALDAHREWVCASERMFSSAIWDKWCQSSLRPLRLQLMLDSAFCSLRKSYRSTWTIYWRRVDVCTIKSRQWETTCGVSAEKPIRVKRNVGMIISLSESSGELFMSPSLLFIWVKDWLNALASRDIRKPPIKSACGVKHTDSHESTHCDTEWERWGWPRIEETRVWVQNGAGNILRCE